VRRRLHLVVRGIVQGVNFRAATRREAMRLALDGWVRNLPDGSVEVLADGDEPALGDLLAWAHRGPRAARVDAVEATWGDSDGETADRGFDVRY
jgi:acylphosphatase